MLATVAFLALCPAGTIAQVPPGSPTIEELLEKLSAQVRQADDAKKAAEVTREEIRKRYADLTRRLAELGFVPGPGPGPGPVIIPPKADPLRDKVQAAYVADHGTKTEAQALAALYRACADLCKEKDVGSGLQLLERLQDASRRMVGANTLVSVRKIVTGELSVALGTPSETPLSAEQCELASALFGRLAMILDGL